MNKLFEKSVNIVNSLTIQRYLGYIFTISLTACLLASMLTKMSVWDLKNKNCGKTARHGKRG